MTKKAKIYLVHGFRVSDGGKGTVGKLAPYIYQAGYEPVVVDYGFMQRVRVRLCNKRIAKVLASMMEPGSFAIGHSNGCAMLHEASHLGAPLSRMAYINPALNRDAVPGHQIRRVDVWHSESDSPVTMAKFIPFSIWGDMGAVGYQGEDDRMRNIDKQNGDGPSSDEHSDVFTDEKLLRHYGPEIVRQLTMAVVVK